VAHNAAVLTIMTGYFFEVQIDDLGNQPDSYRVELLRVFQVVIHDETQ
jgi:hypothetical protein